MGFDRFFSKSLAQRRRDGRSIIGWSGLIFSVYAINFLWAPFIDKLKIPILTNKIGHRKSWILSMQSTIGICLIGWVLINPNENLYVIITIGLIIAICSATRYND